MAAILTCESVDYFLIYIVILIKYQPYGRSDDRINTKMTSKIQTQSGLSKNLHSKDTLSCYCIDYLFYLC